MCDLKSSLSAFQDLWNALAVRTADPFFTGCDTRHRDGLLWTT